MLVEPYEMIINKMWWVNDDQHNRMMEIRNAILDHTSLDEIREMIAARFKLMRMIDSHVFFDVAVMLDIAAATCEPDHSSTLKREWLESSEWSIRGSLRNCYLTCDREMMSKCIKQKIERGGSAVWLEVCCLLELLCQK